MASSHSSSVQGTLSSDMFDLWSNDQFPKVLAVVIHPPLSRFIELTSKDVVVVPEVVIVVVSVVEILVE